MHNNVISLCIQVWFPLTLAVCFFSTFTDAAYLSLRCADSSSTFHLRGRGGLTDSVTNGNVAYFGFNTQSLSETPCTGVNQDICGAITVRRHTVEGMHGEECSTRENIQHTGTCLSSSSCLSSYCFEMQWKDDLPLLAIQYSGDIYSMQTYFGAQWNRQQHLHTCHFISF